MEVLATDIFGLTTRDRATISGIFAAHPEVTEVWIYGSRAIGIYKPGSDIDLAIMNVGVDRALVNRILEDFEESSLPYFIDLHLYPALKNKDLINEIATHGKEIYRANQRVAGHQNSSGVPKP